MKVNGHGGFWIKAISLSQGAIVHNAEYEVLTSDELEEVRTSGCGGWAEGLPKFRRVEHAILKVAEDDVFYPQALGFTEGAELTVWLKRGALNTFDKIEDTIVRSVRVLNNNVGKARRVEVVCVLGRYFRNAPLTFISLSAGAPLPPGYVFPPASEPPEEEEEE